MKKIFLVLLGLISVSLLHSQCWVQPDCTNEVSVTGILSNQNYNGSTCFDGSGIIKNSVNVNNWDFISYSGSLDVKGPINMNNKTNVYVNGAIIFDQVHFTGGDTLFINGSVVISKVVSNNSNNGSRNVIMLSETSSLVIKGTTYAAGDIIVTPGNSSNEIDVQVCSSKTLPVHISNLIVKQHSLSWDAGVIDGVQNFTVQGSQDAQNWVDLGSISPSEGTNHYPLGSSKTASLGLIILLLLGIAIPSRKLKVGLACIALMGVGMISCSKSTTTPDSSYKYYRIKVLNVNGSIEFSSVVHN